MLKEREGEKGMISALVLAAGEGRRMGTLKQLLPWSGGQTLLQHVVARVLACEGLGDIRVILGAGAGTIRPYLNSFHDTRLQICLNSCYQEGMLSSIRTGLEGLQGEAFFIILGDQPFIRTEILDRMLCTFKEENSSILVPVYEGRRGHPVLFSTTYIPEIMELEGEGGLRMLLRRYPRHIHHMSVHEEGIHIDLDYPRDYELYGPGTGEGEQS